MPDTKTVVSGLSCSSVRRRCDAVRTEWSPQPEHHRATGPW